MGRKTPKGLTVIFCKLRQVKGKKSISIRKGSLRGFSTQMFGTKSPMLGGGWRRETLVSVHSENALPLYSFYWRKRPHSYRDGKWFFLVRKVKIGHINKMFMMLYTDM